MTIPADDLALVADYCAAASPAEHADKLRVEYVVDGPSVTIIEASMIFGDWLRVPSARLDHDGTAWRLFCFNADGEPMPYETWEPDFEQPASMQASLAEIESDPTDIFWG